MRQMRGTDWRVICEGCWLLGGEWKVLGDLWRMLDDECELYNCGVICEGCLVITDEWRVSDDDRRVWVGDVIIDYVSWVTWVLAASLIDNRMPKQWTRRGQILTLRSLKKLSFCQAFYHQLRSEIRAPKIKIKETKENKTKAIYDRVSLS